jgi:predicted small lipoprotein YifL
MHHRPRTRLRLALVLIGTLTLLAACGQKGPLYLPTPDNAPHSDKQKDQ